MVRICTLLALAVLLGNRAAFAAEKPLNVVLIMADDVGYECFGAYGSKQYLTPRIDKLADTGVRFTHCYATPLCTPSRVALMTGKSNVRNYADFGVLLPDQYTFADLFRAAGYATVVAGKWQLQGSANVKGVPAGNGFDTYCLWNTPLTARSRYWNPSLDLNGKLKAVSEDDYGPDHFANFLIEFMEQNRERPFFVYYPMALPHTPFLPTPDSADRGSKDAQRNFEDMVAYIDKLAGRIEDAIGRLGLSDQTVLIFTSDNGTHHDIRSHLDGRVIRGDKGAPTDAGTHVPLIVKGPALIPGGRVVDDLIDFADFLPTLAEMIGAELPGGLKIDGRSFWPQLRGQKGNPREWLYTYYFPRPYAKEFNTPYQHPEVRFARDKRYKLYGDGRLFDVVADPAEEKPLRPEGDQARTSMVRKKLQGALDYMPARGERIPEANSRRSEGVPLPRW